MLALKRLTFVILWVATLVLENQVSKGTIFDMEASVESYQPKYDVYHNLSKLNDCIHNFASRYPDFVDVEMKYRSRLGMSQYLIRVTNFTQTEERSFVDTRTKILFSYGEHASEFLPVESMLFLLENITAGLQLNTRTPAADFSEFVLNNIDLYIVAILNPDGRFAVEKTNNYCWKGTSSGMDLNSLHNGKNTDKREGIIQIGQYSRVTSEPECKVITGLLTEKQIDVVISFHSGGRYIVIPVCNDHEQTTSKIHHQLPDTSELVYLASLISNQTPVNFPHTIVDNLSVNQGSILSYAARSRKIPFSYIISLWSNEEHATQQHCFGASNPPSEELQRVLQAVHPLYSVIFKYVVEWKQIQLSVQIPEAPSSSEEAKGSRILSFKTLIALIVLFIFVRFITRYRVPFGWRILFRRPRRIVTLRSLSTAFSFVLLT